MIIPIFNSLHQEQNYKMKSYPLNIKILNNLDLKKIDKIRYPLIKIINSLKNEDSLFETIIVSANDSLVNKFLKNEIKFTDISKNLLKFLSRKEFKKFIKIRPKNINQIEKLADYVSLKINTTSV